MFLEWCKEEKVQIVFVSCSPRLAPAYRNGNEQRIFSWGIYRTIRNDIKMKTKKELKDEYKQMEFPMGVFQVKCMANQKSLIDNSTDMESKWKRHKMELKFGNHRNKDLQNDWNKYGADNFGFEVLSELKKNEEENMNYNKELKTLQDMIIEEMNIENMY